MGQSPSKTTIKKKSDYEQLIKVKHKHFFLSTGSIAKINSSHTGHFRSVDSYMFIFILQYLKLYEIVALTKLSKQLLLFGHNNQFWNGFYRHYYSLPLQLRSSLTRCCWRNEFSNRYQTLEETTKRRTDLLRKVNENIENLEREKQFELSPVKKIYTDLQQQRIFSFRVIASFMCILFAIILGGPFLSCLIGLIMYTKSAEIARLPIFELHIYPFLQLPSEEEIKAQYDNSLERIYARYGPLEENLRKEKFDLESKLGLFKEEKTISTRARLSDGIFGPLMVGFIFLSIFRRR